MKLRSLLTIILCGAVASGAQASPISLGQIQETQNSGQSKTATSTSTTTPNADQITVESLEHPEFVKLADGRIIPYGAGVACSDSCVGADIIERNNPGFNKKWLLAVPVIAGIAVVGVMLGGGDASLPRPTNVGGVITGPNTPPVVVTPTDPNTPTTPNNPSNPGQPQPVPEPATIAMMGAGIAMMARNKVREMIKKVKK
jgi:PEP-CTERM motif